MPQRVGSNGAVTKPSSSAKSPRIVRPTETKVIDLTRDSTEETSENSSGEESTEERESDDAPERHIGRPYGGRGYHTSIAGTQERSSGAGQAAVGRKESNKLQQVTRRDQDHILEDSFIVTTLHHRPWGAGDHKATIGVFPTEREAKFAAAFHFQSIEEEADGWESEWRRLPRDGMLQLYGHIEEGEKDSETYSASIKPYQQKRPVAVKPVVPSAAQTIPTAVKPRYVYVVKEEQRMNVGEDDPQGFYNELGDLRAVVIHGVYVEKDAANDSVREIYGGIVEKLAGAAKTVIDTFENSMASILVEDQEDMTTFSISVEKRPLK